MIEKLKTQNKCYIELRLSDVRINFVNDSGNMRILVAQKILILLPTVNKCLFFIYLLFVMFYLIRYNNKFMLFIFVCA